MEQQQASEDTSSRYQQLDDYDWDNDKEFQSGLRAILTSASPDQATRLILRARCYYFARKFSTPVDFEGYQHWTISKKGAPNGAHDSSTATNQSEQAAVFEPSGAQQTSSQTTSAMGSAPPPASFAEICELIAAGKPIPGIKEIPDTILEGQATESQAQRRKKPWEKDADPAPVPSWARAG